VRSVAVRASLVLTGISFAAVLTGCRSDPAARSEHPSQKATQSAVSYPEPRTIAPRGVPRLHALLINGGDRAERNYLSHYLHVRELTDLLLARGVARKNIVVFASDGTDPAPDLAVLDERRERHFELIEGTGVGKLLRPEVQLIDSRLDGLDHRPATHAALRAWFENEAAQLEPGSVLLLYVTDHGTRNANDLRNNSLLLWGESLDVAELRGLLRYVPAGVRTVMLMSQCFSGSFGNVLFDGEALDGSVCGFFSSPADRFAYGCYPENRGKDNIGYSFEFLDALRSLGSFHRAYERVVLTDGTPDVPNRTSDQYLDVLLRGHAGAYGLSYDELADSLLEHAFLDEAFYGPTFARIDELAATFGATAPRTLSELHDRMRTLPPLRDELRAYAQRWDAALNALRDVNLNRFLEAHTDWSDLLRPQDLDGLAPEALPELRRAMLRELARFTADNPDVSRRLRSLRAMERSAKAAAYRMEVRIAVALRIRDMLARVAGQVFLESYGTPAHRAAYEALRQCEELELAGPAGASERRRRAPSFPPLDEELRLAATVRPGWLGIQYQPVEGIVRTGLGVQEGAVAVTAVEPGSPAAVADLRVGDVVLGPPGDHFRESRQIREWVMSSIVGQQRELEILRDGATFVATVRIAAPPEHAR